MSSARIALANLPYPATPGDSVTAVVAAITGAAAARADVVCLPECFVPGYRAGAPTTSAVVRPDGTVQSYQPYGEAGLLLADLDLAQATGLLAKRLRP